MPEPTNRFIKYLVDLEPIPLFPIVILLEKCILSCIIIIRAPRSGILLRHRERVSDVFSEWIEARTGPPERPV